MSVGIEGNLDAGVAHLVANVAGGFALGNQLAGEEVSQVMKARACHAGLFRDGLPNLCVELIRAMKPLQSPGKMKAPSGLPTFRSASIFITLSVAAMRRNDFRDFGGPTCHSHLCAPSVPRRFEIA